MVHITIHALTSKAKECLREEIESTRAKQKEELELYYDLSVIGDYDSVRLSLKDILPAYIKKGFIKIKINRLAMVNAFPFVASNFRTSIEKSFNEAQVPKTDYFVEVA